MHLHYFIGRDMTETRRAQELVLRETEERKRLYDILSNTINSMVDAVLVSDVTGNVVISNPAAERLMGIVSGLTPEEWVKPNEVIGPDGTVLSLEERPLMRAVRGELVENFAMSVRHRESNKMSYIIANGGPMRDGTAGSRAPSLFIATSPSPGNRTAIAAGPENGSGRRTDRRHRA